METKNKKIEIIDLKWQDFAEFHLILCLFFDIEYKCFLKMPCAILWQIKNGLPYNFLNFKWTIGNLLFYKMIEESNSLFFKHNYLSYPKERQ